MEIHERVIAIACIFLSGCLTPNEPTPPAGSSAAPATTTTALSLPAGARAAKIVFKVGAAGSFNSAASNGTSPSPAAGLQAVRVFVPSDGTLLAEGTSSSAWPKWLSAFELGTSGNDNSAATEPACARFAIDGESNIKCNFLKTDGSGEAIGGAATFNCGVSSGVFRVSEYDCRNATPGTGGGGDSVYLRAYFNRDTAYLGASENIMAVVEYSASGLNPGPANPSSCFTDGSFTPGTCSDMLWQGFLKTSAAAAPAPFLMFVPPTLSFVNTSSMTAGSGVSAKQIILPLASDPDLKVFQLSRIKGLPGANTAFTNACGVGNSPLCVGMVFYSITFYRI